MIGNNLSGAVQRISGQSMFIAVFGLTNITSLKQSLSVMCNVIPPPPRGGGSTKE